MNDAINPAHYTKRATTLEPIDVIRWAPFDLGCCLKYIFRVGLKDDELTDWKKARQYFIWAAEGQNHKGVNVDEFLEHYGLLLKKFEQFKDVRVCDSYFFFSDIEKMILKNIKRLENRDE